MKILKLEKKKCLLSKLCINSLVWGLCLVKLSCQAPSEERQAPKENSEQTRPSAQITIKYAKNFKVTYQDYYKIVTLVQAFQDTQDSLQYVLVPRGMPQPKGFQEEQIIETPLRGIVNLSHTQIALLELIGELNTIKGINASTYLDHPEIQKRIKQGKIIDVGPNDNLNQELVVSLQPDVLMITGFSSQAYQKYQALRDAGIRVVVNSDWLEHSPLGRAEWLKFMALFYNQEAVAEKKFAEIEAAYLKVKKVAQEQALERPTVFNGFPYDNTWYVPGGKSYYAQIIKDAQAEYIWQDNEQTGSFPADFEAIYERAHTADFWIHVGNARNQAEVLALDPRIESFKVYQTGKIFNNNKRANAKGGNDYYLSGLVQPHIILSDLVKILHPELLPEHNLVYYQALP